MRPFFLFLLSAPLIHASSALQAQSPLTIAAFSSSNAPKPILSCIGAEDFAAPIEVHAGAENTFIILDIKLRQILWMSREGRVMAQFGETGQGPGELQSPITIGKINDSIYVYDNSKPAIMKFDISGTFLSQVKAPKGSFARFFDSHLLIHSPFWKSLFTLINLDGDIIATYGEGMNDQVRVDQAFEYVRLFSLMKDRSILATTVKGQNIERYQSSGEVKVQKFAFDFSPFTKKRTIKQTGEASFSFYGGMPIKDLMVFGDEIGLLVEDENKKNTRLFLVFHRSGKHLKTISFSKAYAHMQRVGDELVFIDEMEACLDVFRLSAFFDI